MIRTELRPSIGNWCLNQNKQTCGSGNQAKLNQKKAGESMTQDRIIYGSVYSGVSVYEMQCRGVAVMRRRADSYLNATQLLKVAQIDKGKRTKILEREV